MTPEVTADVGYEPDWDVVILPSDTMLAGYCNKGARAWFAGRGVDWARFVSEGVPLRELGAFDEHVRPAYERALGRLGRA
ncbi:MAG: hypothetical protein LBW85_01170 [Deltaproteobacteria bacterium]|nr:hypothetical protein [Deltaproteobacteria bacterium]